MEYRQIISVTGLGGLFQLISTKNDGAIVKSLDDESVKFISARVHHITPLESIEIYTYEGNIRLHEVFEKMKENDGPIATLNSKKDAPAARQYFKSILPEFDEDRVYASDIKKILKWYAILKDKELLDFDYLKEPADAPEGESEKTEDVPETAVPKQKEKKGSTKKAGSKETKKEASSGDKEKPSGKEKTDEKKKTAPKSTTKKKSTPKSDEK